MDVEANNIEARLQQDIAVLSLHRLNIGTVIAAVLSTMLLGFSVTRFDEFGPVLWSLAILVIMASRTLALQSLNKHQNCDVVDLDFCRKVKRLALFSGVSDGIIWSSANWIIFSNNLTNHYLIISLTIGAATTYGLIYLFQPRVAAAAAGLAILPLVVFSYGNLGADVYQLAVFVAVFCVAISFAINGLKKLILDYHRESFQHRMTAIKEKESNFIFNQHWGNTPLAAIEWDKKFKICRWNPSAEAIFGYTEEQAIGQSIDLIFAVKDIKTIKSKWRKLWRGQKGQRSDEICTNKKGDLVHCEWHDCAISRNSQAIGITSFVEDVSFKVQSEQTIKNQANFDTLTGLPNRRQMMDKINQSIKLCQTSKELSALIFLDLDHFKDINDTKGHEVGDIVLKEFAQRLLPLVRHKDMVARFGGDEFVVLLEGLGKTRKEAIKNTQLVADKLLYAGIKLCSIENLTYDLDVSGGITLIDGNTKSANELLKSADLAMYQVKQNGRRGICFYDESLSLEAEYRVEVLRSLRDSLENEEFELHCQPIVNIEGDICFHENLLRWKRGGNKLLSAGDFIDIISTSPMIVDLGYWIFNKACQNIKALCEKNLWHKDAAFFVNVSPKQLVDETFSSQIIEIIKSYNIDPSCIVIEITEESLIRSYEVVLQQLNELSAFGIRIALDDFGTGYSSLALLKDLPVSFLKLDKEFIRNLLKNKNNHKNSLIIEAVIKLCGVMQISVIAEGVESEAQYKTLKAMGCDYIQGFYFYKPMPFTSLCGQLAKAQNNVYKLENFRTTAE